MVVETIGEAFSLAGHRPLQLWPLRGSVVDIEPRMQLPQGSRHGDAGVDAGQGVPVVAAGKPAVRYPRCGSRNVVVLYEPPRRAANG
jgi:hypothetical protein